VTMMPQYSSWATFLTGSSLTNTLEAGFMPVTVRRLRTGGISESVAATVVTAAVSKSMVRQGSGSDGWEDSSRTAEPVVAPAVTPAAWDRGDIDTVKLRPSPVAAITDSMRRRMRSPYTPVPCLPSS
jgi:hypothetical protein